MVLSILRSRKFSKRVLLALLVIIIPAFVFWGAGSLTDRPELIGTIGGTKVYPDDFMESFQGIKSQIFMSYYGNI